MSGSEILVLVVAAVFGPFAWAYWISRLARLDAARQRGPVLRALGATLAGCTLLLLLVLVSLAAHDVRDSFPYLTLYLLLGLAWIQVAARLLPCLGLSVRDDLVERGNAAALPVVCGFLGAMTLAYAGGNIGDGPGWWVVVACALLGSLGVGAAWLLLNALASVAEVVTVERDRAAGWRLCGFLLACGLVAGRAVAGDWVSGDATLRDFATGAWPLLLLVAIAALVERATRPQAHREPAPVLGLGVLPGLAYLVLAASLVAAAGWPAGARP